MEKEEREKKKEKKVIKMWDWILPTSKGKWPDI